AAVETQVRIAAEQRAVVQRRRVAVAIALERARVALGGDDRIDLDDAARARLRREAAAESVDRRAAGTRYLSAVVVGGRDAVVDPLEWHPRDIGAQDFLRQRVYGPLHSGPIDRIHLNYLP